MYEVWDQDCPSRLCTSRSLILRSCSGHSGEALEAAVQEVESALQRHPLRAALLRPAGENATTALALALAGVRLCTGARSGMS